MAKKSAKAAKSTRFQVRSDEQSEAVDLRKPKEKPVAVSLLHYRAETECFSEWSQRELKEFSRAITKLRDSTRTQLQGKANLCKKVMNVPKHSRFVRPKDVSPELAIFEIRVDNSNRARMHGVFLDDVFHLLWLDRKHELCS